MKNKVGKSTENRLRVELNKLQSQVVKLETEEIKRKQMEDALRETEEKYRLIVENSNDVIMLTGPDGIISYLSPACKRVLGYDPNELVGKQPWIIEPNDLKRVKQAFSSALKGKSGSNLEYSIITKAGEKKDISHSWAPILKNNEPQLVVSIIRDITENKNAEEAIRENEERFRSIAEESFDIIFMMDTDGEFKYISPAVKRSTGYTPEELMGKPLRKFIDDSELVKTQLALEKLMENENVEGLELDVLAKDGSIVYFEVNVNAILRSGKIIGFQGIARDVTERKHTENEMKKRLMKFKLEEGKVYLVQEATSTRSLAAFQDLLKVGFSGLVISRTPKNDFEKSITGIYDHFWLSENGGKNKLLPDLGLIEQKLELLPKRKCVLIDRLDYLISKHGFKKVLTFIQHLRELAIISNLLIILSIDPLTIKTQNLRQLEKETYEVEALYKSKLPEYLIEFLRIIYEQNIAGTKPSFSDIGLELNICKPTVRKRARLLISGGFVIEHINGRRKNLEITERGKNTFLN